MRISLTGSHALLALLLAAFFSIGASNCGEIFHVQDGESIQDAVDAAQPGDTIVVSRGFYSGVGGVAVVDVQKDGITLIGKPGAIIDATGYQYAVKVGDRSTGCLTGAIQGFSIHGFTFQNAENSGVLVVNAANYSMTGGRYLDNEEYGPFPVCSTDGVVAFNYASGHDDAAIYVGQSDGCLIEHNVVLDSVIGIEVENSSNVLVAHNRTHGNTAGIFVVVLPGLNLPFSENVTIEYNDVFDNNRINTAGGGNLALLPEGTGILNLGGDFVTIRHNRVRDNRTYGIALASNPFSLLDPRIEPFVDGNEVTNNVVQRNGYDPDEDRALAPPADIAYSPDVLFPPSIPFPPIPDPDPEDNCFADNIYLTEVVVSALLPDATLADFPCD